MGKYKITEVMSAPTDLLLNRADELVDADETGEELDSINAELDRRAAEDEAREKDPDRVIRGNASRDLPA